jgi:hypothetical protein
MSNLKEGAMVSVEESPWKEEKKTCSKILRAHLPERKAR